MAIGVGVAREPIDAAIALGTVFAVVLSILLWWAYFARIAEAGEHALQRRADASRVVLARDAYTYLHFAIVAGVILAALGVEDAMAHVGETEPFGGFGAAALASGLALYLLATAAFGRIVDLPWSWVRVGTAVALAASIPLLAVLAPMGALAVAVVVVAASLALEGVVQARRAATPRVP